MNEGKRIYSVMGIMGLCIVVIVSVILFNKWGTQHRTPASSAAGISYSLANATNGIHLLMPFNYRVQNFHNEVGKINVVWGASYPDKPSGVLNTYYIPFDREPSPTGYQQVGMQSYSLSWWQKNHPDWLEYQCNKKTLAYEFGNPEVPLNIASPAVQQFMWNIMQLALQQGYTGIALDNLNLDNTISQRCGHFTGQGQWVQQFSGGVYDPAYENAVTDWVKFVQDEVHAYNSKAFIIINYSPNQHPGYIRAEHRLYQSTDMVLDERGFTNWGNISSNYTDGSLWQSVVDAATFMQTQGTCYDAEDNEPEKYQNITPFEIEWNIANYLLVKGTCTYMYITGSIDGKGKSSLYGQVIWYDEYSKYLGTPVRNIYRSNQLYVRKYSDGLVIVNQSADHTYPIILPQSKYVDLEGNKIGGTVNMKPHSGYALIGRS